MYADSGGGNRNGADDAQRHASQDLRRATSLLRLLRSSEESTLEDPELQQEFQRLHELLERIDRIAEGVEGEPQASGDRVSTEVAEQAASEEDPARQSQDGLEQTAWQPGGRATMDQTEPEPDEPAAEPSAQPHVRSEDVDDRLARWWINFNGDVSLERLAKLRAELDESPFTIDTRYDEITDGLIVLRVVTEQHISMNQLDWILGQLMDLVGLDRKSAIVSRQ